MQQLCYDYALAYLARYPKTSHELGLQLQKKWYASEEIAATIEKLQQVWFLDDRLYAEMYLRSEVGRKGKPLFVIQQKLYKKWVDRDLIAELVGEEEEMLLAGQREKIAKEIHRRQERWLDRQHITKKLQSRWYAFRAIQDVFADAEEI